MGKKKLRGEKYSRKKYIVKKNDTEKKLRSTKSRQWKNTVIGEKNVDIAGNKGDCGKKNRDRWKK